MSTSIDERTAWNLVRAVHPGDVGEDSFYVYHDSGSVARLLVHSTGRWEVSGTLTAPARDVLDLYLPLQVRADLVVGQIGQSLDGRIATETGQSHYITGPADIRRLHRLRALVDAVIVGAGTVASDDPRLTVREIEGENPVRVVLDPRGRLDRNKHVFSDGSAPTLVIHGSAGPPAGSTGSADPSAPFGADVICVPVTDRHGFDPWDILEVLRARGLRRVLVEGGGITVSRFLQAGALDRLHVTVAPILIGSGRPALVLDPIASLDQAVRARYRCFKLGDDVLFDLDLRGERASTAEG